MQLLRCRWLKRIVSKNTESQISFMASAGVATSSKILLVYVSLRQWYFATYFIGLEPVTLRKSSLGPSASLRIILYCTTVIHEGYEVNLHEFVKKEEWPSFTRFKPNRIFHKGESSEQWSVHLLTIDPLKGNFLEA